MHVHAGKQRGEIVTIIRRPNRLATACSYVTCINEMVVPVGAKYIALVQMIASLETLWLVPAKRSGVPRRLDRGTQ